MTIADGEIYEAINTLLERNDSIGIPVARYDLPDGSLVIVINGDGE